MFGSYPESWALLPSTLCPCGTWAALMAQACLACLMMAHNKRGSHFMLNQEAVTPDLLCPVQFTSWGIFFFFVSNVPGPQGYPPTHTPLHTHKKLCVRVTWSTRPEGHRKDRLDMSYNDTALDKTTARGLRNLLEQNFIQIFERWSPMWGNETRRCATTSLRFFNNAWRLSHYASFFRAHHNFLAYLYEHKQGKMLIY